MYRLTKKTSEFWTEGEIKQYVKSIYGIDADKPFKLKRDAVKVASKIYARMGIRLDIVTVAKRARVKGNKHPCPKHTCYNSLMAA